MDTGQIVTLLILVAVVAAIGLAGRRVTVQPAPPGDDEVVAARRQGRTRRTAGRAPE